MLRKRRVHIPRILILSALLIVLQHPAYSQDSERAKEFNSSDNLNQGKLVSTYREFFKNEMYYPALESWWTIFNEYPGSSEKLYVDGVTMYRHFIKETPEGQSRENKIDTLMLI